MPSIDLVLWEVVLRELEKAEVDGNFKSLRTAILSVIAGTAGFEAGNALKCGGFSPSQIGGASKLLASTSGGNIGIGGSPSCRLDVMATESIIGRFWRTMAVAGGGTGLLIGANNDGVIIAPDNVDSIQFFNANFSRLNVKIDIAGNLLAGTDNTQVFGGPSNRWSTAHFGSAPIVTSNALEKTPVLSLSTAAINAAKQMIQEIGIFQFLSSIAEKGEDTARWHVGMTVQRAIEIMEAHGLDPFRYAFICFDKWDDKFIDHPATDAVEASPAQLAEYEWQTTQEPVLIDGVESVLERKTLVCTKEAVPAVEAKEAVPARREQIQWAGERYGFRADQLCLFLMAGMYALMMEGR